MSKTNKTLLIILIILIGFAVFFWFTREKTEPGGTQPTESNFWSRFNPFNESVAPSTPPPSETPGEVIPTPPGGSQELILRKVSNIPIAGYGVFQKERYKEEVVLDTSTEAPTAPQTEFVPAVRYVARADGNIWQTFADKIEERRFTSTIIPKVYEAYFGGGAEAVIMRHLKADERTIETFTATLPKEILGGDSSESAISGSFLPDNITELAVSPDGTKIFYLYNQGENAIGIISGILGDKKTQIVDSPATEWLASWKNAKVIALATKPSGLVSGYLYNLNPDTKSFTNVLSGIAGLTALGDPAGKKFLFADGNLSLFLLDGTTRSSIALGARTLPEKCTWDGTGAFLYCAVPSFVPPAVYPDAWYRGEVSFNDSIWKIDAETGVGSIVLEPEKEPGGESVDAIKPSIDQGENYLFFVNKKDSRLWEMKLR
ncbi:MAG: hypothetical protein AAB500_00870 [Patescibacteria group bacterium]